TISGTAILTGSTGTINVGGNWTNYGQAGFTEGTGTVNFNGAAQAINTVGGETFNNVIFTNTGTKTPVLPMTANADLTISGSAILDGSTGTINVGGNWTSYGQAGFT